MAPHRLTALRDPGAFQAQHNAAGLDQVSLHYIDYGTEVEVTAEHLGFCLVQLPLAGLTVVQTGVRAVKATARSAVVTAPGETVRMRYSAGNPRLMVRIATPLLHERLAVAAACGTALPRWSASVFDTGSGAGRTWRSLVSLVVSDLDRDDGLSRSPVTTRALQLAVVDGLIASLAEAGRTAPAGAMASGRIIRRAARLIEDHCAEPLRTPDIAETVGVSVRTLQEGFRTHLGTTPMAHMRHARLQRVRECLIDGSAQSVAQAAHRWGVGHLGRFSADYRAAFGESPSETLGRSR
ncbi:AraC family transcriptional regulator [Xylanimonas ulmi]